MRTLIVLLMCGLALVLPVNAEADVDALLGRYPARTVADGEALAAEFAALGVEAVRDVCGRLVPGGAGDDNAARYALSGLAKYVSAPGRAEARAAFEQAVLAALQGPPDPEAAVFLVQQLEQAGTEASIPVLGTMLRDEALAVPAAQALSVIGGDAAGAALAGALAGTQGRPLAAIIEALGVLEYAAAANAIAGYAAAEDPATRECALHALARMGRVEDAAFFVSAIAGTEGYARSRAFAFLLEHAHVLARHGNRDAARRAAARLFTGEGVPVPVPVPVRVNAFDLLLPLVSGGDRAELLQAAATDPGVTLRREALRIAASQGERDFVFALAGVMKDAAPDAQADITAAIGTVDDRAARNVLLRALENEHIGVRIEAIRALPRFSGARLVDALLSRFEAADQEEETAAIQAALRRFHAAEVGPPCVALLPSVSAEKQVALLQLLAAKRAQEHAGAVMVLANSEDAAVRLAARDSLSEVVGAEHVLAVIGLLLSTADDKEQGHLQDALVAAALQAAGDTDPSAEVVRVLREQQGFARALLMATLPRIGGKAAYARVLEDIGSDDAGTRGAAMAALSAWPAFSATRDILPLARSVDDESHRDALLRGYVRLVRDASRSEGKKVELLGDALAVARTPAQKRLFIADLTNLRTVGALQLLAGLLSEESLRRQAVSAILKAALPQDDNDPGLRAPYVAAVLQEVLAHVEDEETRAKVLAHIERMPQPDAEGFMPLFNGADLAGWTGDTKGYQVRDGVIVCTETSHGNLYTELNFSDFVLRFEFRLAPGANNGLGIRTPLFGHAAYDGMELQIIDDDAHPDLKPYQYHGSIYGLVPAKRGALRPAGEWNVQEVRAEGPRIQVVLNGETILDADLEEVARNPFPDEKEHPGLLNASGRIAFLGHGSQVEFRNIRIKELK